MSYMLERLEESVWSLVLNIFVVILGIVGTALISIYGNLVAGITFLVLFIVVLLMFIALRKYHRFLKVLSSGARGYYFTFPHEQNAKVWLKAKNSLKYLGISSDAIGLREFINWTDTLPGTSSTKFLFLLMHPRAKALLSQKAHQKGKPINDPQVQAEVAADRVRIQSSVDLLKASQLYRDGRLEIRLYDEFVPWWMYILNDDELFLGVLPRGHSGLDGPVLIVKRRREHPSIFDSFMNIWERMWQSAKQA